MRVALALAMLALSTGIAAADPPRSDAQTRQRETEVIVVRNFAALEAPPVPSDTASPVQQQFAEPLSPGRQLAENSNPRDRGSRVSGVRLETNQRPHRQ